MSPQAAASVPPEEARAAVEEVLALPEFAGPASTFLQDFARSVTEFLRDLLPEGMAIDPTAVAGGVEVVLWILLGVAVILIARFAWKRLRRGERAGAAHGAPDPERERRDRITRLRRAARDASARGEHVLAMRLEFTALVVGLGQRGDLEYREAFTNRELLERGKPGPDAERMLRPLVPELDRKSFGGEPAEPADVQRLSALCDRWLGAVA